MKLLFSDINDCFWRDYQEVIKLETFIAQLKKDDLPFDFILTKLDEVKKFLSEKEHEINFFFIKKEQEPTIFQGRKVFDEPSSYVNGDSIQTFKVFFNEFISSDIYEKHYKHGYFISMREPTKVFLEEQEQRINKFIYNIRNDLSNFDVYLFKNDIDSLVEGISFSSDDIFFLKYHYSYDGDRSEDYIDEKNYEEFNNSGACDLAYELWKENKDTFLTKLKAKRPNNEIEPTKEVSGKSETSYLNIIQALKDELLKDKERFKTQDDLIKYLSEQYQGYTGLSDTNLREKFAKANKI